MDLYLDFDGVLVDTINITYKMMESLKIDINNQEEVINFYQKLNWFNLLSGIKQINEQFRYIDELKELGIFDIYILTTVNSLEEIKDKIEYIRKYDKNKKIISAPRGVNKKDLVSAKNSILVDDYSGNLISWLQAGGIPIKFSAKKHQDFITINSLQNLTDKCFIKKLKKDI